MADTDRDLLVRIDERVKNIRDELLTPPDGRVPKLEAVQDDHAAKINTALGSVKTLMWVIGGVGILAMAFGGVLLAHVMSGK